MRKNYQGFTLVEVLLIIIVLTLISFAGWYVWHTNKNDNKTTINHSTAKDTKQSSESDPTADWKSYTSTAGKYSLKYPASWVTASNPESCDNKTLLLGPTAETAGSCGSEGGNVAVIFNSFSVESGPLGLTEDAYNDITTKSVTVDKVAGQRQSGTYADESAFVGPAVGTKTVVYIFKTNGLIYKATYSHTPDAPDVEKDFDLMVTKTLRFE